MAVLKPYKGDYYLWKYLPSEPASIVFALLYLIISILHCWRIYKLRCWFCIWFAIGCICEVVGYVARATAYNYTDNIGIYIVQAAFLVIAPAFYAASIYMTLSRIIRCVRGEHLSLIRIDRLTWAFVLGDQLSLQIQSAASGLTSHAKLEKIGEGIVVAGLFVQLALLAFFFVVAAIFQIRLKKQPTRESYTSDAPWRQALYMIYFVSAVIFLRSIFRVVEYIQGQEGYSLGHEWTLYVFDGVPMLIVAVVFWVWHPASVAPAATIDDAERVELTNTGHKPVVFRGLLWSLLKR